MSIKQIAILGAVTRLRIQALGRAGCFLLQLLVRRVVWRRLWPTLRFQLYELGVLSCFIMLFAALFIGAVVGLQGYHTLAPFGATPQLGQLLALSVCRELGPVVSALLFAGRAGTALTAEIGLMKATEQLDSMDMMGVDPLGRLIYPRFLSGWLALPILSLMFTAVAIYGGYCIGVLWLGIDAGAFWSNMQTAVHFKTDVWMGLIKSIIFAFVVVWIAVYQGFMCLPTAIGISRATTKTVVYASLAVLGFDFILTAMMIGD